MPLITKPNYNQIFASQAPDIDKPPLFNNPELGWAESRSNNGKPTIKQFNYLLQMLDLKSLWILQNGACLPYDATIEYASGSLSLKDGIIQQYNGTAWAAYRNETPYTLKYFTTGASYPANAEITLTNGDKVKNVSGGSLTNDPNVDMAGWVKTNGASQIFDESGKSQQEINTTLSTSANSLVNLKFNNLSTSIRKSIGDIFYDLVLDVTWFGAKADHNFETGVGTDNTSAVQKCLEFIGALGSIRALGKVVVKFPAGPYQLKSMDIPTFPNMGFGLQFSGDGENATALYFDESYADIAMKCSMQGVLFLDMAINGSLTSVNVPAGRTKAIEAKLTTNRADIDIKFKNVKLRAWQDFADIYGRGVVFDNCVLGAVTNLFTIYSKEYVTSDTLAQREMRHYSIRNCRADAVGNLISIVSEKPDQQINNIIISGNDFHTVSKLIKADSSENIINNLVVTGNTSDTSFASGVIDVYHIANGVVNSNNFTQALDNTHIPASNSTAIQHIVKTIGNADGLVVTDNTTKNLRLNAVTIGGNSKGVIVDNNTFPECFTYSSTGTNRDLVRFNGTVEASSVKGNTCWSSNPVGVIRQTNLTPQTTPKSVSIKDNMANFNWADKRYTSFLSVYAGGVDITSQVTSTSQRQAVYHVNDDYIEGMLYITCNTQDIGAIEVSLPVPAIAEQSNVTSAYSGSGDIIHINGFNAAGYSPFNAYINATTQKFQFFKIKDMAKSAITWEDGPTGNRTIHVRFKYRFR